MYLYASIRTYICMYVYRISRGKGVSKRVSERGREERREEKERRTYAVLAVLEPRREVWDAA